MLRNNMQAESDVARNSNPSKMSNGAIAMLAAIYTRLFKLIQ